MDVLCHSTQSVSLQQFGKPTFFPAGTRLVGEAKNYADVAINSSKVFDSAINKVKRPSQAAFKSMLCLPVNVHKEGDSSERARAAGPVTLAGTK